MPALLCDVDGTLVDSSYLHTVCWWQALAEAGETVPASAVHRAIGMGSDRLLPHVLGATPPPDRARALTGRHDELFQEYWPMLRPTDGAADLLRACAERGVRVVLATSAREEELEALRDAIAADEAITGATSADDVTSSKPAPDLVLRALELASASPEEAVFLGDTAWDIRAARAAGLPCVALTSGGWAAAELYAEGAEAVYSSPAALLADLPSSPLTRLKLL